MKKYPLKAKNLFSTPTSRKNFLKIALEKDAPEEYKFLHRLLLLVDRNMSNSGYKLIDLAEDLHITERQLFRKVKAYTGLTPNKLVREIKLQYALMLFEQRSYSTIKEVAARVGYMNSGHFVKIFEEKFGKHPMTCLSPLNKDWSLSLK